MKNSSGSIYNMRGYVAYEKPGRYVPARLFTKIGCVMYLAGLPGSGRALVDDLFGLEDPYAR